MDVMIVIMMQLYDDGCYDNDADDGCDDKNNIIT